jgi:hypothetical protein
MVVEKLSLFEVAIYACASAQLYVVGTTMPKKRKSLGEDDFTPDVNPSGTEMYEKGGRVLRARETCQCPVCGMFFSPTEIQAHAQACLYILYTFFFCFCVFVCFFRYTFP